MAGLVADIAVFGGDNDDLCPTFFDAVHVCPVCFLDRAGDGDRTILVFVVFVLVGNDCPDRAFPSTDARFSSLDSFPLHDSFPGSNLSGLASECGTWIFNDGSVVRNFLGDQPLSLEAWNQEIFGNGRLAMTAVEFDPAHSTGQLGLRSLSGAVRVASPLGDSEPKTGARN